MPNPEKMFLENEKNPNYKPVHLAFCKKDGSVEDCDACTKIRAERQMKGSLSLPPKPDLLQEVSAMIEDINIIIKLTREIPVTLNKESLKKKYLEELKDRANCLYGLVGKILEEE